MSISDWQNKFLAFATSVISLSQYEIKKEEQNRVRRVRECAQRGRGHKREREKRERERERREQRAAVGSETTKGRGANKGFRV